MEIEGKRRRIIIVDGEPGSGRQTLLEQLSEQRGVKVIRGIGSATNPDHNFQLTPEAQLVLQGKKFGPEDIIHQKPDKRYQTLQACLKSATLQLNAALSDDCDTAVLDRSPLTYIAYAFAIQSIALEINDPRLIKWSAAARERTLDVLVQMMPVIGGIILMEEPKQNSPWSSQTRIQILQQEGLRKAVNIVETASHIPVLVANINQQSRKQIYLQAVNLL